VLERGGYNGGITLAKTMNDPPAVPTGTLKRTVGIGPRLYVKQRRLGCAKLLLRETRQPLAAIALQVRLVDQSHLSSIFRRETGAAPAHFRAASA